jgi:hypothetical protein
VNVGQAIEVRDRAIALGLENCCDECRDAIERLRKIGTTGTWTITKTPHPTYPQQNREATIGLGQEDAVRWLRRQIGASNVVA